MNTQEEMTRSKPLQFDSMGVIWLYVSLSIIIYAVASFV